MNQKTLWKRIQRGELQKIAENLQNFGEKSQDLVDMRHKASGDTVVHLAARHGFISILKYFAENWNIGLQLRNLDNKTPLHEASASGHCDVIQYLLSRNVDVDCLKKADWTPLMLACTKMGNGEVVRILVEHHASMSLVNKDGWNCFHIACRLGDVEIVKYLLKKSRNIWDTKSNNGRTPLHTAALHGNKEIIEILLKECHFNINAQDSCGITPLIDAIKGNHIDCAILLLSHDADLHVRDVLGRTAIHIAAESNRVEAIKYLVIEQSVNPNERTVTNSNIKPGYTPLDWARKEKQREAVEVLISLGANNEHPN